jgi:hypothetical protein
MKKSVLINNKVEVSTSDEKIFYYTVLDKVELDLETAKKMVEAGLNIGGHVPSCANLVDIRQMLYMKAETRDFLAKAANTNLVASAIVMNSKLQTGLVNFFTRFSKPKTPTKVFTDLDAAENWLYEQLKIAE